jgi:hypothetical protein
MMSALPLPSPETIRADVQRMVDFGPRLPGYEGHDQFCAWLVDEFVAAGLDLLPCDEYVYDCWRPEAFGLEILDGTAAGPIEVATTYVRSASTSPDGVEGPLVYAGTMPTPGLGTALSGVAPDTTGAPEIRAWADALPAGLLEGSIAVVDLALPTPLNAGVFTAVSTYLQWTGRTEEDWARLDYTRPWIGPWPRLEIFVGLGIKGVVFVLDAAFDVLAGNYSPHVGRPEPIPALVVDRNTGRALRAKAATRPAARLTLLAPVQETRIRSVTAVLPGESDEVIVVNSHSDGQNGFEENGAVALVSLARHFASLPAAERLRHPLAFAAWPGHMSGVDGIEDASCWIAAHPDLCERAVAAVTMEHLGSTEWVETADDGYHATGENEIYAIWTTQGPMKDLVQPALVDAGLQRHALMKPPIQITPGRPFHEFGIPHVAGIAGPAYLLVVSENGEMDKFDEKLASRQIAFYADVLRRIDTASAADLRTGDPTLGANPTTYRDQSRPVDCGPASPPRSGRVE